MRSSELWERLFTSSSSNDSLDDWARSRQLMFSLGIHQPYVLTCPADSVLDISPFCKPQVSDALLSPSIAASVLGTRTFSSSPKFLELLLVSKCSIRHGPKHATCCTCDWDVLLGPLGKPPYLASLSCKMQQALLGLILNAWLSLRAWGGGKRSESFKVLPQGRHHRSRGSLMNIRSLALVFRTPLG